MAEGLLKAALLSAGKTDCVVNSAGLRALAGHPPDPLACQLMQDNNIDISNYTACQLNKDMIRKADLILVMEAAHKAIIEVHEPSARGKVFRLGEWSDFDIVDPYQQGLAAFVTAFNLIEQGVSDWVKKLSC